MMDENHKRNGCSAIRCLPWRANTKCFRNFRRTEELMSTLEDYGFEFLLDQMIF